MMKQHSDQADDLEHIVQDLSRKYPEGQVRKSIEENRKVIDGVYSASNIVSSVMLLGGVVAWQLGIFFDLAWLKEWIVPIIFTSIVYLAIPERIKSGYWFYAIFLFSLGMSVILNSVDQVSHFYSLLSAELIVERISIRLRSRKR